MSPEPLERGVPRVDVLGVQVSAINMDQTLDLIDEWVTVGVRRYVCVTGVHGVMESRRDATLQQIHNDAGLVTPDGMPLVWWSKTRGWHHTGRVYGPDLMLACCERSIATQYRHFFYGGGDGVADLLAEQIEPPLSRAVPLPARSPHHSVRCPKPRTTTLSSGSTVPPRTSSGSV